jgi:hypothetical protein
MPITSNADELAGSIHAAAEQLQAGLGVEDQMAAAMMAAVRAPRRTGVYASSIRPAVDPPTAGLRAGVRYAAAVEFGTRHMRGQRVLKQAVERSQAAWTEIANKGVQTVLDRI